MKKNNKKNYYIGGTNPLGGGQKSIGAVRGIGAGEVIVEKTPHNAFHFKYIFKLK